MLRLALGHCESCSVLKTVWYKTTSCLLHPPQWGLVLDKVHICSLLLNTKKLKAYKEIGEHPTSPHFWDFVLLSCRYHMGEHRTPWREEIRVAINTLKPGNSRHHLNPSRRDSSSSFAISHASAIRSCGLLVLLPNNKKEHFRFQKAQNLFRLRKTRIMVWYKTEHPWAKVQWLILRSKFNTNNALCWKNIVFHLYPCLLLGENYRKLTGFSLLW